MAIEQEIRANSDRELSLLNDVRRSREEFISLLRQYEENGKALLGFKVQVYAANELLSRRTMTLTCYNKYLQDTARQLSSTAPGDAEVISSFISSQLEEATKNQSEALASLGMLKLQDDELSRCHAALVARVSSLPEHIKQQENNISDLEHSSSILMGKRASISCQLILLQSMMPMSTLEQARELLMEFFESTGGRNWSNNTNWGSSLPLSNWHGVDVNENGFPSKLSLERNNLNGRIPNSFTKMISLKRIDLNHNNLNGEIPDKIGCLFNLTHLWLNNNEFGGRIPDSIGKLRRLVDLHLNKNNLIGEIPEALARCGALKELWLHHNNLVGEIPSSIGAIQSLETVHLEDNNGLSGKKGFKKACRASVIEI